MICKICENVSEKIFDKVILQKYKTNYYRCSSCSFIQTDKVTWLAEAYESAITSLDIGLPYRNNNLKNEIPQIIDSCFPNSKIFLDYAGGYGMFVRLMRDKGFNFFRQDDYCDNVFANYFDIDDAKQSTFDVVTAFEVFEHFDNPLEEIQKIFNFSDTIIFSTEIAPESNSEIENWWYITPETGQHLAFYSKKSMQIIAEKFKTNYYSKNNSIHIFSPIKLTKKQLKFAFKKRHFFWQKNYNIKRQSLLQIDFEYIKNILNTSKSY
jgi:hypothetical protein